MRHNWALRYKWIGVTRNSQWGGIPQFINSAYSIYALIFFYAFMVIGVNLFFILSGWCRIHLKAVKAIDLILKVYIIFFIIQVSGILTGFVEFNFSAVKHIIDPFDYYWFLITYLLLMLASPFLNMVIDAMDEKMIIYYIIFFMFVFCGYGFVIDGVLHINKGYSFLMACGLYVLGGGIRKKIDIAQTQNRKKYLLSFILSGIITFGLSSSLYALGFSSLAWRIFSYNNPFIVIEAISLILFITGSKKTVNSDCLALRILPRTTITAYLCHSTCWLATIRNIIVVCLANTIGFSLTLLLMPFYAFLIYVISSIIDVVYERIIGKRLHALLICLEKRCCI